MRKNIGFYTITSLHLFLAPTVVYSDAVDEKLKFSMSECVENNYVRFGGTDSQEKFWSKIVSQSLAVSYSFVKILGINQGENLETKLTKGTVRHASNALKSNGFVSYRGKLFDLVDHCLPIAIIEASKEQERQQGRTCPDMTDYLKNIYIVETPITELMSKYGSAAESRKKTGAMKWVFENTLFLDFSKIFWYGTKDGYAPLDKEKYSSILIDALEKLSTKDFESGVEMKKQVERGLGAISTDGVVDKKLLRIETDLLCLLDYVEIYPDNKYFN